MIGQAIFFFLALQLIALVSWPFLARLFPKLGDKGYFLTKAVGLIIFSYLTWIISLTGIIPFSRGLVIVLLIVIGVLSFKFAQKTGFNLKHELKEQRKTIIIGESIFALLFVFFLFIRSFSPDIFGAEKFMDFAFLNAIVTSSKMPAHDPWLSGFTINYYYFGYFTQAVLIKISGITSGVGYNTAVALIPALCGFTVFGLVKLATKKVSYAIWAIIFLGIIGNLAGAVQVLSRGSLQPFDWWMPSRVITGTITEFPFFSFIWADLHPHLMALPGFVVIISFAYFIYSGTIDVKNKLHLLLLAAVMGASYITSVWDLPTIIFLVLFTLVASKESRTQGLIKGVTMPFIKIALSSLILVLPFFLSYSFGGTNSGLTSQKTDLWQFAQVFGFFFFIVLVYAAIKTKQFMPLLQKVPNIKNILIVAALVLVALFLFKGLVLALLLAALFILLLIKVLSKKELPFSVLLVTSAIIIIAGCEIVYVDSTYGPELQRLNTVFKFYFHSWTLLAIGSAMILPVVWETVKQKKLLKLLFMAAFAILLGGSLVYTVLGMSGRSNDFKTKQTIDGVAHLQKYHPQDFGIYKWLQDKAPKNSVIVEAAADPYGYFSRISANTGLQAVLGWQNHEQIWRKSPSVQAQIAERARDITTIYETTKETEAQTLLKKYSVSYIIIGESERQKYKLSEKKFEKITEKVYENGSSYILRVK